MRRAALIAPLLLLTSCGLRADSKPHDVPEDNQVDLSGPSVGTNASGAERIYLVEPGEDQLLRSVQREATSATELMDALLRGPSPGELDEGYSSAIPSTVKLLRAREQAPFLYVDVTDELTDLSGQGLLQALAQIVYTGSELDGVDRVQITVNGDVIACPKRDGWNSATQPSLVKPLRRLRMPCWIRCSFSISAKRRQRPS